jgi:hypothetical protein
MLASNIGHTEVVELLRSKAPLYPKTSNSTVTPTNSTIRTVQKGNEPSSAFGLGLYTFVVVCTNALVFSILCLF